MLEWLNVMTWEMTAVERRDDGSLVRIHTARIVLSDQDCIYLATKFKERLEGSRMVWASLGKVWNAMDSFHLMVPSYPPGLNLQVTTYPGTPENSGVTQVVRNVWYVHHHTRDAAIDHLRRARPCCLIRKWFRVFSEMVFWEIQNGFFGNVFLGKHMFFVRKRCFLRNTLQTRKFKLIEILNRKDPKNTKVGFPQK